ncbi:MAG: hypothetical protein EXR69_06975 [Myxococcales bacterium]|nr:hypothetical protein [Myxococcales bacterium]
MPRFRNAGSAYYASTITGLYRIPAGDIGTVPRRRAGVGGIGVNGRTSSVFRTTRYDYMKEEWS